MVNLDPKDTSKSVVKAVEGAKKCRGKLLSIRQNLHRIAESSKGEKSILYIITQAEFDDLGNLCSMMMNTHGIHMTGRVVDPSINYNELKDIIGSLQTENQTLFASDQWIYDYHIAVTERSRMVLQALSPTTLTISKIMDE